MEQNNAQKPGATSAQPLDFSAYVKEHTEGFTGRNELFEAIDAWLAGPERSRYFLITGAPGSGKTAIAGRLCQFSEGKASPPASTSHLVSGFIDAAHFCLFRERDWINSQTFAMSLSLQLARNSAYASALAESNSGGDGGRDFEVELVQQIHEVSGGQVVGVLINNLVLGGKSPEDFFNSLVRRPLEVLYRQGFEEQIVILVDALDDALLYTGPLNILSLLSSVEYMPSRVRFILTSRPDENLSLIRRGEWEEYDLSYGEGLAASKKDVNQYILETLSQHPELVQRFSSDLSPENFASTLAAKSEGLFLYVHKTLQMLMDEQERITAQRLEGLPVGLDAMYRGFLDRLTGKI